MENDNVLCHYGGLGMRWGIVRSNLKSNALSGLQRRSLTYDNRSAQTSKKSEQIHAKKDLARSNRAAVKAEVYRKKAANVEKKALTEQNDIRKMALKSKVETLKYKAAVKQIKGNRLSKTTGYSIKAMRYSIKSDKFAARAAKARKQIAKNQTYIALMDQKINSLQGEDLAKAKEFMKLFE